MTSCREGGLCVLGWAGVCFSLVSRTGVLRLPAVYSRAPTASQADTLGAGLALAGVALALGWGTTTVKTVLLLVFVFATNPTAAHAISRAAHEEGIEPWTADDDRTDEELYEAARARVPDGGQTGGNTTTADEPGEQEETG